ncbi:MAG TPA: ATP-binding protein [Patescibacteria group bacterium]|nr:ATP-binding protein [Patescibacteria group bacterium]
MLRSIKGQLMIIVFLLVSLSFAISGAINAFFVSRSFETYIVQNNMLMADALAKNVYSFVSNAYNIADSLARNNEVRGMVPQVQQTLFAATAARFPFFNNLYSTGTADGMQIARAYGPNASRRNRFWFLRMQNNPSPWLHTNYTLSGDIAVAGILLPILDKNDNYAAIMGADLKLDYIQQLVERFQAGKQSCTYVLDANGVVLAHPDRVQFRERYNYQTRQKTLVAKDAQGKTIVPLDGGDQATETIDIDIPDALHDITQKALAGESGTVEYRDRNGDIMIGAYCPVDIPELSSRWAVITVENKDAALSMVRDVTAKNAAVATIIVILALLLISLFISKVVATPVNELIAGTEEIAHGNLTKRLTIKIDNELGKLAAEFNLMTETLQKQVNERNAIQTSLKQAHDELEAKVDQRTQQLSAMNQQLTSMNEELQATVAELQKEIAKRLETERDLSSANRKINNAFEELKTMQTVLIQSEKMAALGNLVAGVAHEINTPVGNSLTAASHFKSLTEKLSAVYSTSTLCKQELEEYLDDAVQSSTIILHNLERAAGLIKSFKQVSADQSSEARRIFNVKEYLKEILLSLQPHYKKSKHRILVECDNSLEVNGFPGAFSQIITNLLMNSLLHAYTPSDEGTIKIKTYLENRFLIIRYSDDGQGIPKDLQEKIFNPFFTTKRGSGGTGLGLYIVYNIVSQQFGGTIQCESEPGQGTVFFIRIPLDQTTGKETSAE